MYLAIMQDMSFFKELIENWNLKDMKNDMLQQKNMSYDIVLLLHTRRFIILGI